MNKSLISLTVPVVISFLAACSGGGGSSGNSEGSFSDSYNFTFNGCPTGKHTFTANSKGDLLEKVCSALVDDKLNNFCASGLRKEKFDKDCKGTNVANKIEANANSDGSGNNNQPSNSGEVGGGDVSPKDPAEEQNAKMFSESIAFGEQKWSPSKITISMETLNKKTNTTSSWSSTCSSKNPIVLKASYPALSFSIGNIECDKDDRPLEIWNFLKVMRDMNYLIRRPHSIAENQFVLNLTRIDSSLIHPGTIQIQSTKSLNANVIDGKVFLDLIIETKSSLGFGFEPTPYYYMELKLSSSDGKKLNKLASELEIDSEEETVTINLQADLDK